MQMNQNENRAILRGIVEEAPQFSHKVHGIDFYRFPLCVPRLSGREDRLNILLPQTLMDPCPLSPGLCVEVTGEVRSFNNRSGSGSKLVITLYAKTLSLTEEEPCNQVFLSGVLCKQPILRRTPLGREICDLLLAVNRKYRRADYLPCIAWGSLAAFCAGLEVGDPIRLEGRLQSRTYIKNTGESTVEHTAFELSIMSLALPPEESP
jgi:primosomal replication protein N